MGKENENGDLVNELSGNFSEKLDTGYKLNNQEDVLTPDEVIDLSIYGGEYTLDRNVGITFSQRFGCL